MLCEAESIIPTIQDKSDNTPPQTPTQQQPLTLNRAQSEPGEDFDEEEEEVAIVPDNQTLLRMLEENEKVIKILKFVVERFFN